MTSQIDCEFELDAHSLNYAFKYFELHAAQRMTVFNFFLLLSGALSGGIGASLMGDNVFPLSALFLSALLILLSLVFYKLDRRTSFLIKHAELALSKSESRVLATECRLVGNERGAFDRWQNAQSRVARAWSYSYCFKVVFLGSTVVGIVGLFYSIYLLWE